MVAGEAGGRAGAPVAAPRPAPISPPRASASRKSAMSFGWASSADTSRSSRKRPNCNKSVRYASRVLRERPRSNSRYARKSSTRCSKRRAATGCSMVATVQGSSAAAPALRAATRPSAVQERPQPQEADERLRVAAVADHAVQLGERHLHDLDALVLVCLGALVVEVGGHEDVALLVGEAGRGVEARQVLPRPCALADLLGELALGGVERLLSLLVELSRRQLQQRRVVHRLTRLADQEQRLAVVRDHSHRPRMLDDLPLGLLAVLV